MRQFDALTARQIHHVQSANSGVVRAAAVTHRRAAHAPLDRSLLRLDDHHGVRARAAVIEPGAAGRAAGKAGLNGSHRGVCVVDLHFGVVPTQLRALAVAHHLDFLCGHGLAAGSPPLLGRAAALVIQEVVEDVVVKLKYREHEDKHVLWLRLGQMKQAMHSARDHARVFGRANLFHIREEGEGVRVWEAAEPICAEHKNVQACLHDQLSVAHKNARVHA
jgi:hypothetical protein